MSNLLNLTGKTALVTGGASGIGLGIARGLVGAGCKVMIWGRDEMRLASVADTQDAFGQMEFDVVDVTDEVSVASAMARAATRIGPFDAVFANAGAAPEPKPFLDQRSDDWSHIFGINLYGSMFTMREAARHMIAAERGGALVAIASLSAVRGAAQMQPYACSKAALISLIQGVAIELAPHGIRANVILPGWTHTPLTDDVDPALQSRIERRTPLGRWGAPQDYAALSVYLASDGSAFHTGDTLIVDGGYNMT